MYKIQKILQTPQSYSFIRCYIKRVTVANKEGYIRKTSIDQKYIESNTTSFYKILKPQYILIKNFSTNQNKSNQDDFKSTSRIKNFTKYQKALLYAAVVLATSITGLYVYYSKFVADDEDAIKKFTASDSEEKCIIKIQKNPVSSDDIPNFVPYLLIGGGTASFSAFRAIKSLDPQAKILVISNEGSYPYMRPPLSKEIWHNEDRQLIKTLKFKQWNGSERSLFYEPEDFYMDCKDLPSATNGGIAVARGWNVNNIDVMNKKVYLDDGKEISYDKCLIATGAKPKNLEVFKNASNEVKKRLTLFRTIYDFENLENVLNNQQVRSVVVVGGGFLGSEISCALTRYGKNKMTIYQTFAEKGNMAKVLPEYLSLWTTKKLSSEGVHITPEVKITDVAMTSNNQVELTLSSGKKIVSDHVILAVGVEPNTDLALTSNLETDPEFGGFVVNAELEARSNLYVAGDCACFYDTKLGRRRIEHHDHAVVSGRLAGENMTGARKPYLHQSMFWSDLGPEIGYEAIGIIDSKLPTVSVFTTPNNKEEDSQVVKLSAVTNNSTVSIVDNDKSILSKKSNVENDDSLTTPTDEGCAIDDFSKGVIFYLKDNVVVGIVLWNLFNRMSIARQVINEHRKFDDLSEVAKLFNLYDE